MACPPKIMLVTGASRGIGAATARLAAAEGCDVAVNYRRDKAAADAVAADVERAGRRAVAVAADVAVEDDVERLFATVDARLGRLTHLVCNAGITGPLSRVDALPAKAAREVLDTNVLGAFLCARAAIARMSTRRGGAGGAMVFISSAMATLGGAGEYVMYAASKGAIESLSLGLARELAQEGVRCNVVEPGPIATGIHPPGRLEHITKAVPMGRPGTMEDVARAVLFLLSDQSSFTTGAVLRVAGGR
ncbi:MAG TPA: SDR family oxidoreductase [Xanthobacteraceae bacterium]|nr:SDR family oxidoreductase [Xanthobacteraceae bacterium]